MHDSIMKIHRVPPPVIIDVSVLAWCFCIYTSAPFPLLYLFLYSLNLHSGIQEHHNTKRYINPLPIGRFSGAAGPIVMGNFRGVKF